MSQPAALMAWNMFQKAHKGQGLSQTELAAKFKMQRSRAPVLLAKPKPAIKKRRKCIAYAK